MNRPFARALLASAAVAAAIALAGCDADSITPTGRAQAPISEKTLAEIAAKNMDKESPILARIFKEEAELEIWKKNRDGEYALLKTYPDLPLVGRSRSEEEGRRPPGAGGLLHDHAGADEPEFELLSRFQHRFPERL